MNRVKFDGKRRETMNASFECIEKHLYRRRRVMTLYYATFTDWKKKRRTFSLGSDLKDRAR